MKIQSEWTMPVITRHKGMEYRFNPEQIKEVPDDFDVENKLRHFKVVEGEPVTATEPAPDYRKELIDLPKIGEKKADDIIAVYPERELLEEAIRNGDDLPGEVDDILKEHFGGGE